MENRPFAGYFKRCSTEKLLGMLAFCLRKSNYPHYAYLVGTMLEEANRRFDLEDASPDALWVREQTERYWNGWTEDCGD